MNDSGNFRPRGNLPVPLGSLIGRMDELAIIAERLSQPDCRLLTLTGPAGVGKTRLAIAAGSEFKTAFRDGVWLVELASVNEPSLVAQSVATACGVRELRDETALGALQHHFSARNQLLLIDNCEHLIGASARIVQELLLSCPELTIICTSRQRFGITGETVLPVAPLSVPDLQEPLQVEGRVQYQAIHLFETRARDVLPEFQVDRSNYPDVARICRRLDGIPLAIELAASWIPALDVKEIARRIDEGLSIIEDMNNHAGPHPPTLRQAFQWSYRLLSDRERLLFNRLSVFADTCSLSAIEKICAGQGLDPHEIVTAVRGLVDKSLLMTAPDASGNRYRMLETVRSYAREKLVLAGNAPSLRRLHAGYYQTLAEQTEPLLWGSDPGPPARLLETEHENIRAALRWSTGQGEANIALQLAASMGQFWRIRGHLSEGRKWLQQALEWKSTATPAARAHALEVLGHLCRDQGDYRVAASCYEKSLTIRADDQDAWAVATLLNNLSMLAQFQDEFAKATRLQEESLALFRQIGTPQVIAMSLVSLGALAQLQESHDEASQRYEEALELFRDVADSYGIASCLNNLGNLASSRHVYELAERYYLESLAIFKTLCDEHEIAACLSNLGSISRKRGYLRLAEQRYQQSLTRFYGLGDHRGVAALLLCLTSIAAESGNHVRAATLLGALNRLHRDNDMNQTTSFGPQHEQMKDELERTLGVDAYQSAFDMGANLAPADVQSLALASAERSSSRATKLTRRENEVANLIAEGLTNRQIAERLYIAERTVDTHVEHILAKLGVRTRTKVPLWLIEQSGATTQ